MSIRRRVYLYGSSLFMAGVQASLQLCPELELATVREQGALSGHLWVDRRPDALVFDLTEAQPGLIPDLVKQFPAVVLIGVDFTEHQALVLSGKQHRVSSMQDLVQAIDVIPGFSRRQPFWQAPLDRVQSNLHRWIKTTVHKE